ncbi:hypothetical protein E2C01_032599 [Portunus trituberculatus]|uniref:Uncharacterized protein n=1 Tax=Portunus trituberculatus TaxID=210409 RepID=A0A5B7F1H2_PORTR|nr:hypothetical protein [Portunus trituberculatus]
MTVEAFVSSVAVMISGVENHDVRVSEDGAIQYQVQHHEEHQQDEKGESETLMLTGHHLGDVVDSPSSYKLNSGRNGDQ